MASLLFGTDEGTLVSSEGRDPKPCFAGEPDDPWVRTIASYDEIADEYAGARRSFRERPYVDLVTEGLRAGARVLDAGCGHGFPIGSYLIERGFRVTGVDASACANRSRTLGT